MKTLKKIYDGIVEVEGWIAVVALVAAIVLNAYETYGEIPLSGYRKSVYS